MSTLKVGRVNLRLLPDSKPVESQLVELFPAGVCKESFMSMRICPCPYIYLSTDTIMHTQHLNQASK
jgi:hypothetical protein